ncbi:hypothetical protein CYMTET_34498 [Cymbomonas tetramitiformis]|uniref:Uncharacterized protein n=1 Tax=Cymbomonas tetramitiformis TaxID=36881 RepID=A0AAE0FB75_9CHLO|nr:hypothetical protein CYMTET_34498 [Cymbomonas tetramitiformis]
MQTAPSTRAAGHGKNVKQTSQIGKARAIGAVKEARLEESKRVPLSERMSPQPLANNVRGGYDLDKDDTRLSVVARARAIRLNNDPLEFDKAVSNGSWTTRMSLR